MLLPTVVAWDGKRTGERLTGKVKIRPSGKSYSANLCDLAASGLLPTPTTGNNRNSRNAIQKIGDAHQGHGVSLGLAQVVEISSGILPKEFDDWDQVPPFYKRLSHSSSLSNAGLPPLLPTPTAGVYSTCNMGKAAMEKRIYDGRQEDLNMKLYKLSGRTGKLNPLFIMEMMGFPTSWVSGNFVYGTCSVNGERLKVDITSIRYGKNLYPVSMGVYDLDALEGIRIPGAITRDAVKEGADRACRVSSS